MFVPSSLAVTVTAPATVEEVNVAEYVPLLLFVTAPIEPPVVDNVTAPPLAARFALAEFFSCTVIALVVTPFATIDAGAAATVDCASAAVAVRDVACAPRFGSRLPARS